MRLTPHITFNTITFNTDIDQNSTMNPILLWSSESSSLFVNYPQTALESAVFFLTFLGCYHGENNDNFHAEGSRYRPNFDEPCNVCLCTNGIANCISEVCVPPVCINPVKRQGTCCEFRCKGMYTDYDWNFPCFSPYRL